jgi:hypothetical protein
MESGGSGANQARGRSDKSGKGYGVLVSVAGIRVEVDGLDS